VKEPEIAWRGADGAGRQSCSFLVRLWLESRNDDDEQQPVRIYLRNLLSGKEHYLADLAEVGELLERAVQNNQQTADGAPTAAREAT